MASSISSLSHLRHLCGLHASAEVAGRVLLKDETWNPAARVERADVPLNAWEESWCILTGQHLLICVMEYSVDNTKQMRVIRHILNIERDCTLSHGRWSNSLCLHLSSQRLVIRFETEKEFRIWERFLFKYGISLWHENVESVEINPPKSEESTQEPVLEEKTSNCCIATIITHEGDSPLTIR